jgi:starch synthase (maltosyl-transferring)
MATRPAAGRKTPALTSFEQIVIEDVRPSQDDGRHPVKAIAGDVFAITATVFRHGHDVARAAVRWRGPGDTAFRETPMRLVNAGLDAWRADIMLDRVGRYDYTVVGWTDRYASWLRELTKRVDAAQPDTSSEIAEGLAIVERVAARLKGDARRRVRALADGLAATSADPPRLVERASADEAMATMIELAPRDDEARFDRELTVVADRERARAGAWYELFVRSQSAEPGRPGTFADAERRLADIHGMGFDVVYLAPIHPIGLTNRKGANNRVSAGPDDPGSPWAIGSAAGGHTAVEPALGTLEDFDRFVAAADALGMDVALDFAIQCSPDHPWVAEHPDWFYRRPDGSIRYAENPPKKYEDIYPLNFDTPDWRALWDALREIVEFWIAHGVRVFRVDNPHTKPIGFWTWLLDAVKARHPDVLFLAEAFTRPPMMRALGKRGFTQSYTYFTWRNTKPEITEYLTELTGPASAWSFRPNFFVNTPDILPPLLQRGGPPAFRSRLVLAATLSPTYGIYSGFELYEAQAIPGREEYLNSEKYEIRTRDWHAPGGLSGFITDLNAARRANRSLQLFTNLRFLDVDHDELIAYVKAAPDFSNVTLMVVNLDPFAPHEGVVLVPAEAVGVGPGEAYDVVDLVAGGRRYTWGERNFVRLDPAVGASAHVFRVERRL